MRASWRRYPWGESPRPPLRWVFWHRPRFIRSQQEDACQAIIGRSPARWEKICTAAVPKLKELEAFSRKVIAVGETGWHFTTEAPQYGSGGLSRYLGHDDDTLRLSYLATAASYFAENPGWRWRDDAALVRRALDAARYGKGETGVSQCEGGPASPFSARSRGVALWTSHGLLPRQCP